MAKKKNFNKTSLNKKTLSKKNKINSLNSKNKLYNQKPSMKISQKFKSKLMKIKYDYNLKDIEEVIKKMYDTLDKNNLIKELKKC